MLWELIQTPAFQRLRRIKQLGFSDFVYPGATHSRFSHSIGVFHTARRLTSIIEEKLDKKIDDDLIKRAQAAALLHDVGHGPFSHAFEAVYEKVGLPKVDHESISVHLIQDDQIAKILKPICSGFAEDVAQMIRPGSQTIYGAVVSSQFDADRLDYMRRDRLMTGTQNAAIDFHWLLANLEIGNVPNVVDDALIGYQELFVLSTKALQAAEAYVLGLFQLYPTVYFHKATRGAEKIFTELIARLITLSRESAHARTGLPANHPLSCFARAPQSMERIQALDDTVVWGALPMLAQAEDATVAHCANRLWRRELYKCIDARARLDKLPAEAFEAAQKSVTRKITDWLRENPGPCPRILIDGGKDAKREAYSEYKESKGLQNQILVRSEEGEYADICDYSPMIKAIKTYKVFRLYYAKEDTEAQSFIQQVIQEELNNVANG
ncbi:HD domain-containing protein [Magnetofaba australis]|uniref:HD domain-containing protein n=1 Tax=Magnetofaba australis TaxID=1472297 RepID=UPI001301F3BF|nr:HD domain-containing protein [Magnetofaba australis]